MNRLALEEQASMEKAGFFRRLHFSTGALLYQMGEPELALEEYRRAESNIFGPDRMLQLGAIHLNMGTLYLDITDYASAEIELQRALDISLELEAVNEFNYIVQIMSRLYDEIGDMEQLVIFLNHQIEHQMYLLKRRDKRLLSDLRREYGLEIAERELENVRLAATITRRTMTTLISVLLMATGYGVYYLFLKNRSRSALFERNIEILNYVYSPIDQSNEGKADLDNDSLKRLYARIKKAMEQDKLYKNPELTVGMLAVHVSSNAKYTSSALSVHGKKSFSSFVNFYRINEVKRLLLEQGNSIFIHDLLKACGYRSRSTFYRAFSENTGMTSKEFVAYSERSCKVLG